MKKVTLILALVALVGVARAKETCVFKTINAPVVSVDDLHLEMDLPTIAGTCVNGVCESHVVSINHSATEPRFQITVMVKGDMYSFESPDEPKGSTVPVLVDECGKRHKSHDLKPAV